MNRCVGRDVKSVVGKQYRRVFIMVWRQRPLFFHSCMRGRNFAGLVKIELANNTQAPSECLLMRKCYNLNCYKLQIVVGNGPNRPRTVLYLLILFCCVSSFAFGTLQELDCLTEFKTGIVYVCQRITIRLRRRNYHHEFSIFVHAPTNVILA